jgi:hypothetical protein
MTLRNAPREEQDGGACKDDLPDSESEILPVALTCRTPSDFSFGSTSRHWRLIPRLAKRFAVHATGNRWGIGAAPPILRAVGSCNKMRVQIRQGFHSIILSQHSSSVPMAALSMLPRFHRNQRQRNSRFSSLPANAKSRNTNTMMRTRSAKVSDALYVLCANERR